MHIAVDVRSLMEERHSGVQQYTSHIVAAMLRVAPEHIYHLFYNAARPATLPKFADRVRLHAFGYPNKLFNLSQRLLGQPRWDQLLKADVFFIPSFRLVPLSPHVPYVVVVHDLSFERFPEFWDVRRRLWHRMMQPRMLVRNADHVIAVSEHTARDIEELYHVPREKISIVYSGVTGTPWVPTELDKIRVRKTYRLPKQFMLYLGVLEPRKNISGIIRAYAAIASDIPHDLVIAGARGWRTKDIDRAVQQLPGRVETRVHFPGFIAEEDKAALYAAADLFVYPSFYEGFGFPPLEALLAGTPVITSCNSSLPEVVGQWATLVNPYDISELALVIGELLKDPQKVSSTTRRQIQQTYSWDRAARRTLDIIKKAC